MFFRKKFSQAAKEEKSENTTEIEGYPQHMQVAHADPHSLGNLIISNGFIDEEEFMSLMHEFSSLKIETLLGQFLISKNVISEEELEVVLMKQESMRNGGIIKHSSIIRAIQIARKKQEELSVEARSCMLIETPLKN